MVADPGDPKGAGKGKGAVDDGKNVNGDKGNKKPKAKAKAKGGEGNEGDQNGKPSKPPKTKTPEQESRAVPCPNVSTLN